MAEVCAYVAMACGGVFVGALSRRYSQYDKVPPGVLALNRRLSVEEWKRHSRSTANLSYGLAVVFVLLAFAKGMRLLF